MLAFGPQARFFPGHVHGLTQPCWAVAVRLADTPGAQQRLASALANVSPELVTPSAEGASPAGGETPSALSAFVSWIEALHRAAGLSFVNPGRVLRQSDSAFPYLLLLPTWAPLAPASLRLILSLQKLAQAPTDGARAQEVAQQVQQLREAMPGGSNVPHLLRHAQALDIPVLPVQGSVIQFGQGRRSQWLDSTFTQQTSRLSAQLARDKVRAAQVLRQQGLPVPPHRRVATADEAVEVARQLGGPVVVKPADRDGGVGVRSDLRTEADVRDAFVQASRHTNQVIVERHLVGRDYRLVVFQGELIWAIERVPAGVTGNGRDTVQALVEQANADPLRSGPRSPLKPLQLDSEALGLLAEQQLGIDGVPADGQQVRLHRAANVAAGGRPRPALEGLHPDNRRLAEDCAAALRLDLAGIDFICPDITQSWQVVGGGVCEVNAQPNIGVLTADHLFPMLLRRLVPGSGRVPIAVLVGLPPAARAGARLAAHLQRRGALQVGLGDAGGIHLAGRLIQASLTVPWQQCHALLQRIDLDALVIDAPDLAAAATGLPLDRLDVLLTTQPWPPTAPGMPELLRMLPACNRHLVLDAADSAGAALPSPLEEAASLVLERHRSLGP